VTAFDELAAQWNVSLDSEHRAQYRQLIEGMQETVRTVTAASKPDFELLHGSPRRHGDREGAWRPDTDADPCNAWLCRCRIAGAADGPLADLTAGIKDNIAVAALPCSVGSEALSGFVPEIDATVVARLLDAGATVCGKQNMDAFAMGDAGELQDAGPTWNPHDSDRLAGGSSSGSAAAVTVGDCDIALGTDQAGSVRTPAAWCGVVGCKPTYGLVPYTGVFGMDFGFDHVGVISRDVRTNARVMATIAGDDRQNGSRLDSRQPRGCSAGRYVEALETDLNEMTLGVLDEGFDWSTAEPGVEAAVDETIEALAEQGVSVRRVSAQLHRLAPAILGVTAPLGAATTYKQGGVGTTTPGWHWTRGREAFRAAIDNHADTLSPAVVASLLFAEECRANNQDIAYAEAKNLALALGQEYDACLDACDALAMPTVPQVAVEYDTDATPEARLERLATLPVNTCGANQTGHPALSVPCGTVDGLPVGLQLLGDRFDEATLYRLAHAVETAQ
jgi:amidase